VQSPAKPDQHDTAVVFGGHRLRIGYLSTGPGGPFREVNIKRSRLLIGLALVVVIAGLLYYLYGGSSVPPGQHPLVSLDQTNFDQLRNEFNSASGRVRVIILLSPT